MRTCIVMTYTDGKRTIYSALRGRMRGKAFVSATAECVGTLETNSGATADDYRAMCAKFATPDAPPVYWQAAKKRDQRQEDESNYLAMIDRSLSRYR